MRTGMMAVALTVAVLMGGPARAVTLVETFDGADYGGWKTRWFGANSNAKLYNAFDSSDRGNNGTGLGLWDGDYGPDGAYNSTATNIRFSDAFAASLTSFAFDVISYNDQPLTVYDRNGVTLFTTQLATAPFDPANPFPQNGYVRYTVNSTNGIGGFRFGPFGSDNNIGIDNLVAVTAAVPEPASWAMMIGGFGLVAGLARRRTMRSLRVA